MSPPYQHCGAREAPGPPGARLWGAKDPQEGLRRGLWRIVAGLWAYSLALDRARGTRTTFLPHFYHVVKRAVYEQCIPSSLGRACVQEIAIGDVSAMCTYAMCTHCAPAARALCTRCARVVHALCTRCARIVYAMCTHCTRIVHAMRTHCTREVRALCTRCAPTAHAMCTSCAHDVHALSSRCERIVQAACTRCVRDVHVLCKRCACIVHAMRAQCERECKVVPAA